MGEPPLDPDGAEDPEGEPLLGAPEREELDDELLDELFEDELLDEELFEEELPEEGLFDEELVELDGPDDELNEDEGVLLDEGICDDEDGMAVNSSGEPVP